MVYAIGKVSVFGTSPDHGTVGENDGVWDKVEYLNPDAVDKLASSPRRVTRRFGQGYAIAPETAPKAVYWKSKTKLPPDYAFGNNEIMLVSAKFRDLVEQFEPGIHQFLPVDMVYSEKDTAPFDRFYWFICCQLIDSLDPEHTTIKWDGEYDTRKEDGFRLGGWHFVTGADYPQKAVFNLAAIGSRHLWRDPYYTRGYVNCSDEFAEAMKASGLTGFGFGPERYQEI